MPPTKQHETKGLDLRLHRSPLRTHRDEHAVRRDRPERAQSRPSLVARSAGRGCHDLHLQASEER
jgi:hypothetical protein